MSSRNKFTIRVYGILLNDVRNEVLLADEHLSGNTFTKFPGGGLEFGEGTIDCIKRECLEEMGQQIDVVRHFYTADFFQRSAFHENNQLLSIYYIIKTIGQLKLKITTKKFDIDYKKPEDESFRWFPINQSLTDELTFPIDKTVGRMLFEENKCPIN